MKRIALATVFLAVAIGAACNLFPAVVEQYQEAAADAARQAWGKVEANPVPVALAVGTFLLTVLYHTAKGMSLRRAVEAAATRVTLVPVTDDAEAAVLKRAKARAARTQLLADQIALENRLRKMPEVIRKAEQDASYAERSLAFARQTLDEQQAAHDAAVRQLDALRKERAEGKTELAAIEAELKKLAGVV